MRKAKLSRVQKDHFLSPITQEIATKNGTAASAPLCRQQVGYRAVPPIPFGDAIAAEHFTQRIAVPPNDKTRVASATGPSGGNYLPLA